MNKQKLWASLYDALPECDLTRKEILDAAKQMEIKINKNFLESNFMVKVDHGIYRKNPTKPVV